MEPTRRTLSAKEIAAAHGVSARTIQRLAVDGQLPADRIGKVLRFDARDVAHAIQLSRSGKVA